jgi:hypothetical protein
LLLIIDLVATAAAAAYAIAASSVFFAAVDVLHEARVERITFKGHVFFSKITFFPSIGVTKASVLAQPPKANAAPTQIRVKIKRCFMLISIFTAPMYGASRFIVNL